MLVPRYYFADMYTDLYDYFLSQPHRLCTFHKSDMLWNLGETIRYVYYIKSGITKTFIEHEDGHHKILFFHSKGSVFPGCQNSEFKIEASIGTQALSTVETLRFTREEFYRMFQENRTLTARCFENFSMYINLLCYETAHQEYNNSFIKVCNLLYLFSLNSSLRTEMKGTAAEVKGYTPSVTTADDECKVASASEPPLCTLVLDENKK